VALIGASIVPTRRGAGFGTAVFTELVRRIRACQEADVIRNDFEAGRVAAVRIHRALGFVPTQVGDAPDPARPVLTWELAL